MDDRGSIDLPDSPPISRVLSRYVGSLVVPDRNQKPRPTEWQGVSETPAYLGWQDFPGLRERYQNYGALATQYMLFRW